MGLDTQALLVQFRQQTRELKRARFRRDSLRRILFMHPKFQINCPYQPIPRDIQAIGPERANFAPPFSQLPVYAIVQVDVLAKLCR